MVAPLHLALLFRLCLVAGVTLYHMVIAKVPGVSSSIATCVAPFYFIVALDGIEPSLAGYESAVLPLNYRA